jgi:hypothetical protein
VSTPRKAPASNAFSSELALRARPPSSPSELVRSRAPIHCVTTRNTHASCLEPELRFALSATRTHRSGSAVGSAMACGREPRWCGCCHAPMLRSHDPPARARARAPHSEPKTGGGPLQRRVSPGCRERDRSCCRGLARCTATHSPGPHPSANRAAGAPEIDLLLRPQAGQQRHSPSWTAAMCGVPRRCASAPPVCLPPRHLPSTCRCRGRIAAGVHRTSVAASLRAARLSTE